LTKVWHPSFSRFGTINIVFDQGLTPFSFIFITTLYLQIHIVFEDTKVLRIQILHFYICVLYRSTKYTICSTAQAKQLSLCLKKWLLQFRGDDCAKISSS
jgi:hypothetical protein